MPLAPPPRRYVQDPARYEAPSGTTLWRIHREAFACNAFNPVPADSHFGGGRFDAMESDPFPYLYAASTPRTAIAETLLRQIPFEEAGFRVLPRSSVRGRMLSSLTVTANLTLLSLLTANDLAVVHQDEWLVRAEPQQYPQTRAWGQWLREQAPWAQGVIWPSSTDLGEKLVVLFGDRIAPATVQPGTARPVALDSLEGLEYLNATLTGRKTIVLPPVRTDAARSLPAVEDKPKPVTAGYDEFFRSAYAQVRRVAWMIVRDWQTAEDVAQEAMLIALRRWEDVAEHPNPVAWVTLTAKRLAVRVMHKLRDQAVLDVTLPEQAVAERASGDFLIEDVATRLDIEAALKRLPARQVEAFVLVDVCRLTTREAAAVLEIAEGTIKRHLHEARRNLRDMLGVGEETGDTDDQ